MKSSILIVWLILMSINMVNAAPWTCSKENINVYGTAFCEAEHTQYNANQATIRLESTYKELLQLTPANDRARLIASQEAWLETTQAECEATLNEHPSGPATQVETVSHCRELQIQKRTTELQSLRNKELRSSKLQALDHSQFCLGRLEKFQDRNNVKMCITKGALSTFLFSTVAVGILLQLILCIPYQRKAYFRQGSYMSVISSIRKENTFLGNVLYFISYINIALLFVMFALSFAN